MTSQPSIKKNYFYKLSYEILLIITPLVTTPYVSRVLGADRIGIYSYTLSIMTFFTLFAALGTVTYGTREIARVRDNPYQSSKLFWEIEFMTLITTSICLGVWICVIIIYKSYSFYLLMLTPQLLAVAADISWYYSGFERISYTVIWNSLCKIIGIVLIFLLVKTKDDLHVYILILSGSLLVGNLSMWIHLPQMLVKVDFKDLKINNHFKETLIYFIPAAATSIYTVLDKTLIGIITKNTYENGYYEQATKIINMSKAVAFTSVNSVMRARMSYLYQKKDYIQVKEKLYNSMSFILFLAFGCVGGIIGVAYNFVPLFFGKGYEPVVGLLYIMSPLIVIIGVSNCLGAQYYTPSGKRKQSAKYIVLGALINLFMNIILIPSFHSVGAVIGSLIAETVIAVLYVKHSNEYMTYMQVFNLSWKRLVSAGFMACLLVVLSRANVFDSRYLLLIFQILLGILIYSLLLIILKDELVERFCKEVFVRIKKHL